MIREHFQAVKDLIPVSPRYTVHMGRVRGKVVAGIEQPVSYPYVVIWGDPGDETGESLAAIPDTLELRVRVTYAGVGFEQILDVIDLVRAALSDRRPAVAGRSVSRLKQASLLAVQEDTDVTLPDKSHPMFAADEFVLTSQRAQKESP